MPEVSIIIPLYNDESVISRLFFTLEEYIINKNRTEIILIDDCSTDKTYRILEKKIEEKQPDNVMLLRNKNNKGQSYTRNRGITIAKGEYIAFLDSDDAWHRKKLDIQIELMRRTKSLISGTMHKIITEKELEYYHNMEVNIEDIKFHYIRWPGILFKSPFSTPSVVIHKSLKEHYSFDEDIKYCEEYNLWKRIVKDYPAIKIDFPLTFTFKHDYLGGTDSLSANLWKMQMGQSLSFLKMLRADNYNSIDKLFLIMGLCFSQIKFLKRLMVKFLNG